MQKKYLTEAVKMPDVKGKSITLDDIKRANQNVVKIYVNKAIQPYIDNINSEMNSVDSYEAGHIITGIKPLIYPDTLNDGLVNVILCVEMNNYPVLATDVYPFSFSDINAVDDCAFSLNTVGFADGMRSLYEQDLCRFDQFDMVNDAYDAIVNSDCMKYINNISFRIVEGDDTFEIDEYSFENLTYIIDDFQIYPERTANDTIPNPIEKSIYFLSNTDNFDLSKPIECIAFKCDTVDFGEINDEYIKHMTDVVMSAAAVLKKYGMSTNGIAFDSWTDGVGDSEKFIQLLSELDLVENFNLKNNNNFYIEMLSCDVRLYIKRCIRDENYSIDFFDTTSENDCRNILSVIAEGINAKQDIFVYYPATGSYTTIARTPSIQF